MEAAAWGFVGTLVGALASVGTTWLSTRNSYNIQGARLKEERAERAKAFQRETLVALQEAIHDALRLNARAHMEDFEAHRRSGEWGRSFLSPEVNEGIRIANRKVSVLVERVSDEPLRISVKALTGLATRGLFERSEAEAERNQHALAIETALLFERLGSVLRSNY